MTAKFWAINVIAFIIVISNIVACFVYHSAGGGMNPFWTASPFQLVFIIAFIYLVGEGKLVQKVILAKKLKEDGTKEEFAVIDKSSNSLDKMILDKFKKD